MGGLPLEHVRAVVLTQAWSGALTTQLLGDMGADVIQIEALRRFDPWRGGYNRRMAVGTYPNDDPGERPYNRHSNFNTVNRNKRGITLDLGTPEGKALFLKLVEVADVVAENFASRVMGNLGLGYEVLREANPSLVMLRMPSYGCFGPYSANPGNGGSTEPMTGISDLLGYADSPPMNSGVMYPDPVAGVMGFAAILIALHHRQVTGRGQLIDISQQETSAAFIGDKILEYTLGGQIPRREPNRDPWMAPHGNYRCRGDDAWVAIAVRSDSEWEYLCRVAGQASWARDPRFSDSTGRKRHSDELDRLIEEWTGNLDGDGMARALQEAGVPAARVSPAEGVVNNPQLAARGFFEIVDHPEAGSYPMAGIPWKLSRTPGRIRTPAPCLGEHNEVVLNEYLGVDGADFTELETRGVTGRVLPFPDAPK